MNCQEHMNAFECSTEAVNSIVDSMLTLSTQGAISIHTGNRNQIGALLCILHAQIMGLVSSN